MTVIVYATGQRPAESKAVGECTDNKAVVSVRLYRLRLAKYGQS